MSPRGCLRWQDCEALTIAYPKHSAIKKTSLSSITMSLSIIPQNIPHDSSISPEIILKWWGFDSLANSCPRSLCPFWLLYWWLSTVGSLLRTSVLYILQFPLMKDRLMPMMRTKMTDLQLKMLIKSDVGVLDDDLAELCNSALKWFNFTPIQLLGLPVLVTQGNILESSWQDIITFMMKRKRKIFQITRIFICSPILWKCSMMALSVGTVCLFFIMVGGWDGSVLELVFEMVIDCVMSLDPAGRWDVWYRDGMFLPLLNWPRVPAYLWEMSYLAITATYDQISWVSCIRSSQLGSL